jgi:hypothetical protein
MTGCFYKVALDVMFELARSMNSAAAAVESSRNVIAEGFVRVAPAIAQHIVGNGGMIEGYAEPSRLLGFQDGPTEGK